MTKAANDNILATNCTSESAANAEPTAIAIDELADVNGGADSSMMPRSQARDWLAACARGAYFGGDSDRATGSTPKTDQGYNKRAIDACNEGVAEFRSGE